MNHKPKKQATMGEHRERTKRRRQQRILALVGTVEYFPDYDYKAQRRKKRA